MADDNDILSQVQEYYDDKLRTYGATAQGVDWNGPESQHLRFKQLVKLIEHTRKFSVNDFGCGYGALVEYLEICGLQFEYAGFDISSEMIARGREKHPGASFVTDKADLRKADYTLASGVFNVRLRTSDADWESYMLGILDTMNSLSNSGFAFNALTKYSDADRMRPHLYYADPLFFFDHCRTKYSKYVALLHDYRLYEFTILVRKE